MASKTFQAVATENNEHSDLRLLLMNASFTGFCCSIKKYFLPEMFIYLCIYAVLIRQT